MDEESDKIVMEVVTQKRVSVGNLMGRDSARKNDYPSQGSSSRRDTHKNSIRMTPRVIQADKTDYHEDANNQGDEGWNYPTDYNGNNYEPRGQKGN